MDDAVLREWLDIAVDEARIGRDEGDARGCRPRPHRLLIFTGDAGRPTDGETSTRPHHGGRGWSDPSGLPDLITGRG